jgi:uncharacterized protein YndB with AHSA1/START domain
MSVPVIHRSFTIDRIYPTTADRVYRALSETEKKHRWYVEGKGFTVLGYELDFKVGGFERSRFRRGDGPLMTNDCVYLDIAPGERVVFAYAMTVAGAPMSSSLGCIELRPAEGGTLLRYTEHTAYVDGNDGGDGRREGTLGMLEALGRELDTHD